MVELVPDNISEDTVEALTTLLERAQAGEITGIAFAVILQRRRFIVNVAGTAKRFPTFTRGMLSALDDDMAALVRGR